MESLADLRLFVRIADTGNMSEVARQSGLTPAAASAAIKRLEASVEAILFERSTRSLRLTQAGESFLGHCREALALIEEGRSSLQEGRQALSGPLRVTIPSDLGRNVLRQALNDFQERYPRIFLTLHLSDTLQNFYRESIDVAIRYGELGDSGLIARKLADNRAILCASPVYLQQHGMPQTLADLSQHNCLRLYRNSQLHSEWELENAGRRQCVNVQGDRAADDGALVKQWAVDGLGIALKSWIDIRIELEQGALAPVLPDYHSQPYPLYAVMPSRRFQPARVRALVDFLVHHFNS